MGSKVSAGAPKGEMFGMIQSVHAGKRHIPPSVDARLAEHLGDENLTDRELEVLRSSA